MIKKILIGVLVVYGLGMTVFANLKANEAERQLIIASEQEQAAIQAAAEAQRQQAIVLAETAYAEKMKAALMVELENCK